MDIREYRDTDGLRRWELFFEGVTLVLLSESAPSPYSTELLAFGPSSLNLTWRLSPKLGPAQDYIVNAWVEDGELWAGSFSGFSHHINYITGKVIEEIFTK